MRYLLVLALALLAGCASTPTVEGACETVCSPVEGTAAYQPCLDLCGEAADHAAGELPEGTCTRCHEER